MLTRTLLAILVAAAALSAQDAPAPVEKSFLVDVGTRVPLSMVNSVSTKHSQPGDRVYLETTFPIVVENADLPSPKARTATHHVCSVLARKF